MFREEYPPRNRKKIKEKALEIKFRFKQKGTRIVEKITFWDTKFKEIYV